MGMKRQRGSIRAGCFFLLLSFMIFLPLTACRIGDEEDSGMYQVYFIDSDGLGLVSEECGIPLSEQNAANVIGKLLGQLQTGGSKGRYQRPIEKGIEIIDFQIKETKLSLFFSAVYHAKSSIGEILARAAIVKTMCQVPGVDYVEFYVEDQPLILSGNAVGLMNADTFVDELNPDFAVQRKQVTLYFADEGGQRLVEVSSEVTYSAAVPLAQLLLEKLVAGPGELGDTGQSGIQPSVPSGTTVNSVTIRDNICYVDLSKEFLTLLPDVRNDVSVYSIVNTLCELPNVSQVQFMVEGEQQEKYGDMDDFYTPYGRNLNLISD